MCEMSETIYVGVLDNNVEICVRYSPAGFMRSSYNFSQPRMQCLNDGNYCTYDHATYYVCQNDNKEFYLCSSCSLFSSCSLCSW